MWFACPDSSLRKDLCTSKDRFSSPRVMRDTDESVQWDGHLIVMVNQYSASASGCVVALQDCDRAIVVGQNLHLVKDRFSVSLI